MDTGPTMFGRQGGVAPAVVPRSWLHSRLPSVYVGLKGNPLYQAVMALSDHPPTTLSAALPISFSNARPRPIGKDQVFAMVKVCRRSKLPGPYPALGSTA